MKKYLIKILTLTIIISTLLSIASPTASAIYSNQKSTKITYITNNLIVSNRHLCILTKQKAPTCTEGGYTKYKCIFCRYTTAFNYEAKGHSETIDPFVAPTCTDYGFNEGSHCSKCNTILVEQTKIDPLGHCLTESLQKATPEADGNIKKLCSVCGYGCKHTGGTATCSEQAVCEKCGKAYGEMLPHTPGEAATCTKSKNCTVCGAVIAEKLAHDLEFIPAKDATCAEIGWGEYEKCKNCDHTTYKEIAE